MTSLLTCKNCSPEDFGEKPQFISVFQELEENVDVKESTLEDLERFVCCMYGKPKYTSVNK